MANTNDQKRYIVVKDKKIPFSAVVNDCDTGLCISIKKGENLNSVLNKLCKFIEESKINSAGGANRVYNQELIGKKDGYNAIFRTSNRFQLRSTVVTVNGQRMKLDVDYTETTTEKITFNFPIYPEDQLIIDYNNL